MLIFTVYDIIFSKTKPKKRHEKKAESEIKRKNQSARVANSIKQWEKSDDDAKKQGAKEVTREICGWGQGFHYTINWSL